MKKIIHLLAIFSLIWLYTKPAAAQDKELEDLIRSPRKEGIDFPVDYKIVRPRLQYPNWDEDFDHYYQYLNPVLRKTQIALSTSSEGVKTSVVPNSIMPHAQLDLSTMVTDPSVLIGTWRMLSFRTIRYNDSVWIPTKTYFRIPDTLLADNSREEVIAIFTDDHFKLYAKEKETAPFKRMINAKYKVENRRFIMLYKLSRAAAGVSQFGIDENGYMILHYPQVIEVIKEGAYFSYYTILQQYVFQKIK